MATKQMIPGVPITATVTYRKPSPDGGITPGDVFDLTQYDGYALVAFVKPNRVIAQFSRNTVSGYRDFKSFTDENVGEATFQIPGSCTKDLRDATIHVMPIIQADDAGNPFPFGPDEGKSFELVYLTLNPKNEIPDLS